MDSKHMYIYLKKGNILNQAVKIDNNKICPKFLDENVYDFESCPHIVISLNKKVFLLNNKEEIEKLFLKATEIVYPNYTFKNSKNERELGIYILGDAKGELTPSSSDEKYRLILETDTLKGIIDMVDLQEKLWADTISPSISYENKQSKIKKYFLLWKTKISNFHKTIMAFD